MANAVASRVALSNLGGLHPQCQDGSHAAAKLAVAEGVWPELVAVEEEREARLGNFYAAELDAARRLAFPGGLPPVPRGGRAAAAARVEEVPDEGAPVSPR